MGGGKAGAKDPGVGLIALAPALPLAKSAAVKKGAPPKGGEEKKTRQLQEVLQWHRLAQQCRQRQWQLFPGKRCQRITSACLQPNLRPTLAANVWNDFETTPFLFPQPVHLMLSHHPLMYHGVEMMSNMLVWLI